MNCGKEFESFHTLIRLDKEKKKSLLSNKGLLRNKIIKNFEIKNRTKPLFYIQGSIDNNVSTGINPLNGDYDIDDGVYLTNIDTSKSIAQWETPETVHGWIYEAVEGHTLKTIDNTKCVSVIYANNEKHVDLPIYAEKDGDFYLAVRNKGWIKNNPKKISLWFKQKNLSSVGSDFRKAVRYLKAWKDKRQNDNSSLKLFGGFQMSILADNHFPNSYSNLEEMFYKLVDKINQNLDVYSPLKNPSNNSQDTLEYYSQVRINIFKEEFSKMHRLAKDAYDETNNEKKVEKWKKIFGDRFPNAFSEESVLKKIKNALLSLGHVKKPQWNKNIKGSIKIVCQKNKNGMQVSNIESNQVLNKEWSLRFEAKVSGNIPSSGRKYYWQIVNSGDEAKTAECLRGDFYDGVISKGGKVREEATRYSGYHFVKCFIIQNKEYVAMSDPFIINII